MYLIHLPLLVGFEVLLVGLDWPIALKPALTCLVVGLVLVVSYHLLLRSTWTGMAQRPPASVPGALAWECRAWE